MSTHAWMLTLLIGAPPPADAVPVPRLEKGYEIAWRGTFNEAILRPNVRAFRAYETETRIFVLDTHDAGSDIAIITSIKLVPDLKTTPEPPPVVRLELARVDAIGKLHSLPADSLQVATDERIPQPLALLPMEGLPTLETSLFLEMPIKTTRPGQSWAASEEKRPSIQYRLEGLDTIKGSRCLKVSSHQQTEDWDQPRSDKTAWCRRDTMWISTKHAYAARLERVIEKRDPQSGELGFRSKLVYEQAGSMRYPDRFGDDRRTEISQAAQLQALYNQLLPEAGRNTKGFDELLRRAEQHLTDHFAGETTPYRAALLYVKRKAEAIKRGHIPPLPPAPETRESLKPVATAKAAPDFTTMDLTNGEDIRLSKLRGKPAILIWYQSASARTAKPVLRLAESILTRHGDKVAVMPMAVGDNERAIQQRNYWKLGVHVFDGRDIYRQHNVESTPCFTIIDAEGVVRSSTLGWSDENAEAVLKELAKWVK